MKKISSIALIAFGFTAGYSQVFETEQNAQMMDVNNDGIAVGNIMYTSHIMWSEANGTTVIGVPEGADRVAGGSTNISNDGKYISGTMINRATGLNEMARYDVAAKKWKYLGALAPNTESSAWGMKSDGSVIVGLTDYGEYLGHAAKWSEAGGLVDLGSTSPDNSSRANAISDDGSIIVGWQDNDIDRLGVYWKNGVQTHIVDNDGNFVGEAGAVTPDGKTIIGFNINNPYIWNETEGYTELTHENPMYEGAATAVSDDGKIVVGYFREWGAGALMGSGFIYTKEMGRVDLNEYVATLGYDDLGITFALPLGISPDGKYIVGIGRGDSMYKGFVIKLPATLGTNEVKSANLKIYPNPVQDILHLSSATKISDIEIFSLTGQKVFSTAKLTNEGLNVSKLTKGAYILKAKTASGIESIKFLKK